MELHEKLWGRIQNREFPEMARDLSGLQGLRLEDILKLKGVEEDNERNQAKQAGIEGLSGRNDLP